jgi:SAM-dependent methyltransferase
VSSHDHCISDYSGREGFGRTILDALVAAGKNLDALTIDDLAPTDQFHGGGRDAPLRLARLAGLTPGLRVLDVGGVGGFGCRVTTIDLTESYGEQWRCSPRSSASAPRSSHQVGNALALPFDDGAFDVVWTQTSPPVVIQLVLRRLGLAGEEEPGALA